MVGSDNMLFPRSELNTKCWGVFGYCIAGISLSTMYFCNNSSDSKPMQSLLLFVGGGVVLFGDNTSNFPFQFRLQQSKHLEEGSIRTTLYPH